MLEIRENTQTVEDKGELNHFLESVENLEILEILGIPPVKRPLSLWPLFPVPRFETYLKRSEKQSRLNSDSNCFGLAIRIVRFGMAANRWRFEPLRTIQDI